MKYILRLFQRIFYTLWYLFDPPWDTNISPPELIEYIESHPAGRALDMGCGTGTNVITLAKHGWTAVGVDFAWNAIQKARAKASRMNVEATFIVEDVTRIKSVSGPFDLILDMGCFHSLDEKGRRAYLDQLEHLLAVGGDYLLYVFFRPDPEGSGPGVSEADLQEIADRLELIWRQDGTERGRKPSAWLRFHKPSEHETGSDSSTRFAANNENIEKGI